MERMNTAQAEVNNISNSINELDLQRAKLLEECKDQLVALTKRHGSRIDAARRYHLAREHSEKVSRCLERALLSSHSRSHPPAGASGDAA